MTDDIRLAVGFPTHRKTKRLRKRLGADGVLSLIYLWAWAARERWSGDLTGLSDEDIEEEALWEGEPGALIAALTDERIRFMEGPPAGRRLHDWQEHNPYAAGKGGRITKGKQAATARWEKHRAEQSARQPELDLDAPGTESNAPSIENDAVGQCPPAPAPAPTPSESESSARAQVDETAKALAAAGCPDATPERIADAGVNGAELISRAKTKKGAGKPLAYLVTWALGDAQVPSSPQPPIQPPKDAEAELRAARRAELEREIYDARHDFEILKCISIAECDSRIAAARGELSRLFKPRDQPPPTITTTVTAGETHRADIRSTSATGGR